MKEFFAWLFSQNNSSLQIGLFDGWHIFYLTLVYGGSALIAVLLRNKTREKKLKAVRLFAYLTIGLYLADFFIMPLSDSYDGISPYKLPFNICTVMAALVPFVQFNPKFQKIKVPVITLSIASSTMWMCYPGTALGGQPPFSYVIFQTFMYHGFLYTWGFLNLALGEEELNFRKFWKEFVGVLLIFLWASFGNTVYDKGYNWFFIEESIFPFLSDEIMPFMVIFCVTGTCFVVYCAYYGLRALLTRKKTPAEQKV